MVRPYFYSGDEIDGSKKTAYSLERNGVKIQVNYLEPRVKCDEPIIGIDPGQVNMGVAILSWYTVLYQIKYPSKQTNVDRIMSTLDIMNFILSQLYESYARTGKVNGCIENSAFGAKFGQAALSESRTAAIVAMAQNGINHIEVVPPASIRKAVFGRGRTKAQDVWPAFPPDAATALSCALYLHTKGF